MSENELLEKAKLRVRKKLTDKLDEDLGQLIKVALADLKRIGVHESYLQNIEDPLLIEAVLLYTNANYGNPDNKAELMASYDMMLTKIKGGEYGSDCNADN